VKRLWDAIRIAGVHALPGGLTVVGIGVLAAGFSPLAREAPGLRFIAGRMGIPPEGLWFLMAAGCFALFGVGMVAAREAVVRLDRAVPDPTGRRLGRAILYVLLLTFGALLLHLLEPWIRFVVYGGYGIRCFSCV